MRVVFAVLFCVTSATSASACGVCSALPTYLHLCSLRKFYAPAMFTLGSLTVTTLPWWFESGNHNWAIYFGPICFWARFLCRICKKCVHDEFSVFSVLCCMTRFAGAEVRRGGGRVIRGKRFLLPGSYQFLRAVCENRRFDWTPFRSLSPNAGFRAFYVRRLSDDRRPQLM